MTVSKTAFITQHIYIVWSTTRVIVLIKLRGIKTYVFSHLYLKFEQNTLTNIETRRHFIGVGLEVDASVYIGLVFFRTLTLL